MWVGCFVYHVNVHFKTIVVVLLESKLFSLSKYEINLNTKVLIQNISPLSNRVPVGFGPVPTLSFQRSTTQPWRQSGFIR